MSELKVLDLFSGIGAFKKAMENCKIKHTVVNYCEIDKWASKAYSLLYNIPEGFNLGDIKKIDIDNIPDFNLMTYGFPCQDVSIGGKTNGIKMRCQECGAEISLSDLIGLKCPKCGFGNLESTTRTALLYEALKIAKQKKPEYLIAENVSNLISKSFKKDFDKVLSILESIGYKNYWAVLNAKMFNLPQNRNRVFIVSIRNDINKKFVFPIGEPTQLRIEDILEQNVPEKYYMTKTQTEGLLNRIQNIDKPFKTDKNGEIVKLFDIPQDIINDNERQRRVYSTNGIAPTILARSDSPKIMMVGMLDMLAGDQVRRVYSPGGIAPTIDTMQGGHRQPKILVPNSEQMDLFNSYRVRKLMPVECWKLMGFAREDFLKVQAGINKCFYKGKDKSSSQLYKLAGNSICVNVVEAIFRNLFPEYIEKN